MTALRPDLKTVSPLRLTDDSALRDGSPRHVLGARRHATPDGDAEFQAKPAERPARPVAAPLPRHRWANPGLECPPHGQSITNGKRGNLQSADSRGSGIVSTPPIITRMHAGFITAMVAQANALSSQVRLRRSWLGGILSRWLLRAARRPTSLRLSAMRAREEPALFAFVGARCILPSVEILRSRQRWSGEPGPPPLRGCLLLGTHGWAQFT